MAILGGVLGAVLNFATRDNVLGVLEEGLIYAIMALGVYITYKILDFPDLSVDGTFPMGAAVTAAMIQGGTHPVLTLFVSFLVGVLAGILTGVIHVKLKVRDLLSGIIMMTALYSVNLRIAGRANLPIFSKETIFENEGLGRIVPVVADPYLVVLILLVIVVIVKILLDLFMATKAGYLLRAVGDNETLVTSLAKDKGTVKIIGLALANGLAALSGAVYCQQKGFFDITIGTGTMVLGLASVIIGTKLFKRIHWMKATSAVVAGSIIYKACVSLAIYFSNEFDIGVTTSDLKLITAGLFLVILVISRGRGRKVKEHA